MFEVIWQGILDDELWPWLVISLPIFILSYAMRVRFIDQV